MKMFRCVHEMGKDVQSTDKIAQANKHLKTKKTEYEKAKIAVQKSENRPKIRNVGQEAKKAIKKSKQMHEKNKTRFKKQV